MAALFGPFMVLIFCLSQAFRDVYFANIFQGLDFFVVILIAFGLSTLIFASLTAARSPGDFSKLRKHFRTAVCDERHHRACLDLLLFRPEAP